MSIRMKYFSHEIGVNDEQAEGGGGSQCVIRDGLSGQSEVWLSIKKSLSLIGSYGQMKASNRDFHTYVYGISLAY